MTITKRGKKYRAEVFCQGHRESKSFDRKSEAQAWKIQRVDEIKRGIANPGGNRTVADIFNRYRDTVSPKKKGHRWEYIRINALLSDPIARVPLDILDTPHIAEWRDRRLLSVSSGSVNRELNLISNCFQTAIKEWKWLKTSPTTHVKRPKDPPPRERRISESEIEQVLVSLCYDESAPIETKSQKVAAAFLFAIESAMRLGEICALKASDVDNSVAYIRESKNGHGRKVPLSRRALEIIEKFKESEEEYIFGLESKPAGALFRKYSPVENLTFHDTRHEATTRLAKKVGVLDLARITGHRDIKHLMIYYNESAEDIAKKL